MLKVYGDAECPGLEFRPVVGAHQRHGAPFGIDSYKVAKTEYPDKFGCEQAILPVTTDATDVKSRWEVFTFHFPLMVSQKIYRNFGIAFGTLLNLNTYSTACTQMKIDGIRYKETFKGLQQRLFTAELELFRAETCPEPEIGPVAPRLPFHRHDFWRKTPTLPVRSFPNPFSCHTPSSQGSKRNNLQHRPKANSRGLLSFYHVPYFIGFGFPLHVDEGCFASSCKGGIEIEHVAVLLTLRNQGKRYSCSPRRLRLSR